MNDPKITVMTFQQLLDKYPEIVEKMNRIEEIHLAEVIEKQSLLQKICSKIVNLSRKSK